MWARVDENSTSITENHYNRLCSGDRFRLFVHKVERNKSSFDEYNGSKSRYGSRDMSTSLSTDIGRGYKGGILGSGGEEIDDQKVALERKLAESNQTRHELEIQCRSLKDDQAEIKRKIHEHQQQKNQLKDMLNSPKSIKDTIIRLEKRRDDIERLLSQNVLTERTERRRDLQTAVDMLLECMESSLSSGRKLVSLQVDLGAASHIKLLFMQRADAAMQALVEAKQGLNDFKVAKTNAKKVVDEATLAYKRANEDMMEVQRGLEAEGKTLKDEYTAVNIPKV